MAPDGLDRLVRVIDRLPTRRTLLQVVVAGLAGSREFVTLPAGGAARKHTQRCGPCRRHHHGRCAPKPDGTPCPTGGCVNGKCRAIGRRSACGARQSRAPS